MGKSDRSYSDEFVISCCLDCVIKIFAFDCHIIFLTLELFPLYLSDLSFVTNRIVIDDTTVTTHRFPLLSYVLLRYQAFTLLNVTRQYHAIETFLWFITLYHFIVIYLYIIVWMMNPKNNDNNFTPFIMVIEHFNNYKKYCLLKKRNNKNIVFNIILILGSSDSLIIMKFFILSYLISLLLLFIYLKK